MKSRDISFAPNDDLSRAPAEWLPVVAAVDGLDAETGGEEEELEFAREKDVHVELWVWRDGRRDPERSEG